MSGTSILGAETQLEIIRGSTKTYELLVTDAEDHAIDLTSARIIFSVKCEELDQAPLIQKDSAKGTSEIEITLPREGKANIKLLPSDTQTKNVGEYVFDVWVILSSGARHPVVLPSPFIIKAGVTVLT